MGEFMVVMRVLVIRVFLFLCSFPALTNSELVFGTSKDVFYGRSSHETRTKQKYLSVKTMRVAVRRVSENQTLWVGCGISLSGYTYFSDIMWDEVKRKWKRERRKQRGDFRILRVSYVCQCRSGFEFRWCLSLYRLYIKMMKINLTTAP